MRKTTVGTIVIALILSTLLSACSQSEVGSGTTSTEGSPSLSQADRTHSEASTEPGSTPEPTDSRTPEEMLADIYAAIPDVRFPTLVTETVDLTNAAQFEYNFGIEPPASVKEGAISQPLIGSLAYTLAILRIDEAGDVQAVADAIRAGVNPRKWVCVTATVVDVVVKGQTILLIMDTDAARADAIRSAFLG